MKNKKKKKEIQIQRSFRDQQKSGLYDELEYHACLKYQ